MAKKILISLAVLGVGLYVVISLQPSNFSIRRSATIAAPPPGVFAQVNDFAAWDTWSPWKNLDPNPKKKIISTPSAGKGASFAWARNDEIGEGSLTILESKPDERIDIEQVFIRPFAGKASITFMFAQVDGGTRVTWKMDGTNDFIGKALCLVINMDAKLGKDFDQGLANMKSVAEKPGATSEAQS